jgi:hypothetical protein
MSLTHALLLLAARLRDSLALLYLLPPASLATVAAARSTVLIPPFGFHPSVFPRRANARKAFARD